MSSIEVRDLQHRYPGASEPALRGVDLVVPEGSLFALLGPNGAGKTTLLSLLTGVLPIQLGSIRVAGRELGEVPVRCGLVPQELSFYPALSAVENLEFFAGALGLRGARKRERVEVCIARAELQRVARRPARTYSGGLKRRLNFAIGLLNEPRILFLDEPTVGVDPQSRSFLLEAVRELNEGGTTVVYSSHYMDEVQQTCRAVAILDHGRVLASGDLAELLEAGRREVVIELEAPLDEERMGLLRSATDCVAYHGTIVLPALRDGRDLRHVLGQLQRWGRGVRSLRYGSRDLEDVFLGLTHRSLRD